MWIHPYKWTLIPYSSRPENLSGLSLENWEGGEGKERVRRERETPKRSNRTRAWRECRMKEHCAFYAIVRHPSATSSEVHDDARARSSASSRASSSRAQDGKAERERERKRYNEYKFRVLYLYLHTLAHCRRVNELGVGSELRVMLASLSRRDWIDHFVVVFIKSEWHRFRWQLAGQLWRIFSFVAWFSASSPTAFIFGESTKWFYRAGGEVPPATSLIQRSSNALPFDLPLVYFAANWCWCPFHVPVRSEMAHFDKRARNLSIIGTFRIYDVLCIDMYNIMNP